MVLKSPRIRLIRGNFFFPPFLLNDTWLFLIHGAVFAKQNIFTGLIYLLHSPWFLNTRWTNEENNKSSGYFNLHKIKFLNRLFIHSSVSNSYFKYYLLYLNISVIVEMLNSFGQESNLSQGLRGVTFLLLFPGPMGVVQNSERSPVTWIVTTKSTKILLARVTTGCEWSKIEYSKRVKIS